MMRFSPVNVTLEGKNLIEASAGTGKTYSIALLFVRFILSGISIKEILVVTFTTAATAELRDRIRTFLKISKDILFDKETDNKELCAIVFTYLSTGDKTLLLQRIEDALLLFDEASVFTIHGFCQRVIKEYAFESATLFDTELHGDSREMLEQAVNDFWRCYVYPAPIDFVQYIIADKKLSPNALMDILGNYYTNPDIAILPEVDTDTFSWEKDQLSLLDVQMEKKDSLERDYLVFLHRAFSEIEERMDAFKRMKNIVTFDDLLRILYKTVKGKRQKALKRSLQQQYSAVLIDEFQDTDPLQYEIFDSIFDNKRSVLFYIGDPKQAIYSFRNADIFAYMKATSEGVIPHDKIYSMDMNYRSETAVVKGIERIFRNNENPFVFKEIHFPPVSACTRHDDKLREDGEVKPAVQIGLLRSDILSGDHLYRRKKKKNALIVAPSAKKLIINSMVREILYLLDKSQKVTIDNRPVRAADIAVIVRTNKEAQNVKSMLDQYHVPAVLYNAESVFKTQDAKDLFIVMNAIETGSAGDMRAALIGTLFGLKIGQVDALSGDIREWEKWVEQFRIYRSLWQKKGFLNMFIQLSSDHTLKQRMLKRSDGERRITNFFHIAELLHREESENMLSLFEQISFLEKRIAEQRVPSEAYQIRLESDEEALKIITVHKSKGLEFPIVFCPFLFAGSEVSRSAKKVFYHDEQKNPVLFIGQNHAAKESCQREQLSENLRLVYVALTRAVHRCYLYWGHFNGAHSSALAWLFHGITTYGSFTAFDDAKILADILKVVDFKNVGLHEIDGERPDNKGSNQDDVTFNMQGKTFTGEIDTSFSIGSFSSLSKHRHAVMSDDVDYDDIGVEVLVSDNVEEIEPEGFYAFPKGARPGTALHEILEQLDFTMPIDTTIIASTLDKYGLLKINEDETWTDIVTEKVKTLLNCRIHNTFQLKQIPLDQRLTELEFYFPLNHISSEGLNTILQSYNISVDFDSLHGYLHGFIDLVCHYDGKYYIIDWKSNYLGADESDYASDKLNVAMDNHSYKLQYLIYVVALLKYLKSRNVNISYEDNFGGVFYVFLRGVNSGSQKSGIYYDCPDADLIQKLMLYLSGAAND